MSFTASPTTGTFSRSGSCTLVASGTTGTANCQLTFTPSVAGSQTVTASYSGDSTHHTSNGQSATVTATAKSSPPGPGSAAVGHITIAGTTAGVPVSCSGSGSCTNTLTLSVLETLHGANVTAVAASAKKTTKKTVVVGSKTVTVAAGKSETVTISLNGAGRRLLAKHNPLKTKLAVIASHKTVSSSTITLKTKTKR